MLALKLFHVNTRGPRRILWYTAGLTLIVLNLCMETKYLFISYIIPAHWNGTGSWNPSSWKSRAYLAYSTITSTVDDLATWVARSSTAMVLIYFALNNVNVVEWVWLIPSFLIRIVYKDTMIYHDIAGINDRCCYEWHHRRKGSTQCQYWCSWWPIDMCCQVINSHGVDLVCLNKSTPLTVYG